MRKLGVWQRLGIIASVLWIIGGGLWQRTSDVERAQTFMNSSYQTCFDAHPPNADRAYYATCMSKAWADYQIVVAGSWGNVAFFAIAPVALAWLAAFIAIVVSRWVLAGRSVRN